MGNIKRIYVIFTPLKVINRSFKRIFSVHLNTFLLQMADADSIVLNKEQTATVSFTNPFSHPVSGVLTVAGAGLIQGKIHFR